jgi:electron transfer flavoprotein beta subunit
MKILVPFKRVPDPAADGGADAPWTVNPFDEIAIEEALRIRERGAASEVVAVTVASGAAEEQVRTALAMGVDRAIRVNDERALDPYAVSRILAAVVGRERPDLVLMGKQAVDDDANQTGQMLAGLLAWPQATFISKIEFLDGGVARCTRETDNGMEVIEVTLPAVVTTDLRLNEPRYVSLPGLMKARRRPIETVSLADLGVEVRPRTTVVSVAAAPKRAAGVRVESVGELMERLRAEKLV